MADTDLLTGITNKDDPPDPNGGGDDDKEKKPSYENIAGENARMKDQLAKQAEKNEELENRVNTFEESEEKRQATYEKMQKAFGADDEDEDKEPEPMPDVTLDPDAHADWVKKQVQDVREETDERFENLQEERKTQQAEAELQVQREELTTQSSQALRNFAQTYPELAQHDDGFKLIQEEIAKSHTKRLSINEPLDEWDIRRAIATNPKTAAILRTAEARALQRKDVETFQRAPRQGGTGGGGATQISTAEELDALSDESLAQMWNESDEGTRGWMVDNVKENRLDALVMR